MEAFVPLVALTGLVYAGANLVKMAVAGQTGPVVTQLMSWLIGVGATFLFAASDFGDSMPVGDQWTLGALNGVSLVIVGLSVAGVGNFAYDVVPKNTPTLFTKNPVE